MNAYSNVDINAKKQCDYIDCSCFKTFSKSIVLRYCLLKENILWKI